MPNTSNVCEVIERGARCSDAAYTTVHDPQSWDQVRHPICHAHFVRAYQRTEIFQFLGFRRWTPKADRRRKR